MVKIEADKSARVVRETERLAVAEAGEHHQQPKDGERG
jgi:hypothetical protein